MGPRRDERREDIVRVVREVLAPLVGADGGELYLVRLDERQLALHLCGRFSGCPGNTLATRRIIMPAIRAVAPGLQVSVTSGVLVPPGAERMGA
jgi:Fe-S cluster biogenesis protein NfuA